MPEAGTEFSTEVQTVFTFGLLFRRGIFAARRNLAFVVTLSVVTWAAVFAVATIRHAYVGIDDANITMVYAKHLSGGHGLVYNIGGERVEGFTSLLYVLVAAPFFAITPWPELFLLALCVLLTSLAVLCSMKSLEPFCPGRREEPARFGPVQLVVLAWAVCSPGFIVWTTVSLMEVALWCFVICASAAVILFEVAAPTSSRLRLAVVSLLVVLLPLTRPEGFALAPAVILAFFLARRLTSTTWRMTLPALAVPATLWLVAVAGITVFRLAYFGFPLPNTYYAKVSPDTTYNVTAGVRYLVSFIAEQALMIGVVLAIIAGLMLNVRTALDVLMHGSLVASRDPSARNRLAEFLASSLAVIGLLLPVYAGGDHFEGFRFYQPVWPILIVPVVLVGARVVRVLARDAKIPSRHAWLAATAAVPLFLVLADMRSPPPTITDQFVIAEDGRRLGAALNRLFPSAPPTVGVTAAGGVKYSYQGPIFDLLGLNHVAMGHSPGGRIGYKNHAAFNKGIFWSHAPPVVLPILCPAPIDRALSAAEYETLSDGILKRLFRDERFQKRYFMVEVRDAGDRTMVDDPFFFIPPKLPRPPLQRTAYRDSTLIAYVERRIVNRLRRDGWGVSLLGDHVVRVRMDPRSSRARSACTPRASAARPLVPRDSPAP